MKKRNFDYLKVLKNELKSVMGCTEPAAAALAGAMARELLGENPEKIAVHASRDVIKNVMGVGIPNSSATGLAASVLLGALYGDAKHGLNILSQITTPHEEEMREFIQDERISVHLVTTGFPFYIQVSVQQASHTASVTIAGLHDHVVQKEKDGEVIYTAGAIDTLEENSPNSIRSWDIPGIVRGITECNSQELVFLREMAENNLRIALHGLEKPYGLQVGRSMYHSALKKPETLEQAFSYGAALAASGSDARMAGCAYPVVINSGSGNQGLTIMIPPLVLATYLESDSETLLRALALANLIAIHLTELKGRLSALCGVFTAAIGTCCAFVYLMGGGVTEIENAIQIMIANLTGVICDGAKKTCALKIYSCVQSAAMTACLVMKKQTLEETVGIISENLGTTLEHLETLCREGFVATDKTILSLMV